MLAILGAASVLLLLALILSDRASPMTALIIVPIIAASVAGLARETPGYIVSGIGKIAPVAGMLIFAILFFGVMTDAGLLDPLIRRILRVVGERPPRITVGTALLALLIHLDGSGAICFLVTIPALRPLYDRLNMDRRILACTASLAAGVNFLPWTGPTIRAGAALHIAVADIFRPMVPVQVVGLFFVLAVSWWLGKREELRLKRINVSCGETIGDPVLELPRLSDPTLRRPKLYRINVFITFCVIGAMILSAIDPVVIFMTGTAIALLINYPAAAEQRVRIEAHARAALMMASILFAAGAFSGIMNGSGMMRALADASMGTLPYEFAKRIPTILGLVAMPLSLIFDPDSFYFGVLPVIAQVAAQYGVPAVQVAQAALLGQMTTGFPVSPLTPATFLVAGLAEIDLGAHQRFSIPWLFAASVVMTIAAVILGRFTL